jgi:hypothetical protein
MGINTEYWGNQRCPISDGIYFLDDTFFALTSFTAEDHRRTIDGGEKNL